MTEWETIAWVVGGVVAFSSVATAFYSWLKYYKQKAQEETERNLKVNAYFKKTDEHEEIIALSQKMIQSNNKLLTEMAERREKMMPIEAKKMEHLTVVTNKLAKISSEEDKKDLYKSYNKVVDQFTHIDK